MDRRLTGLVATLIALLGVDASRAFGQQVFVVGPPGPGIFSQEIQPAIDAASSGDIVLVKNGGGQGSDWTISGKSLTLLADTGVINWVGPGAITGIQANQQVLVRGLQVFIRLNMTNNAGPVWIEDCHVFTTVLTTQGTNPLVDITNCASVTLQRSSVWGSVVDPPPPPAVRLNSSNVYAYSCLFHAAYGPDFAFDCSTCGGSTAVEVHGGAFFAAGCTIQGGNGGLWSGSISTAHGHDGGAGINNSGQGAVTIFNSQVHGGLASVGPGGSGVPGAPFVGTPPTLLTGAAARSFNMTSPVRESQSTTLSMKGIPGEYAAIYYSLSQSLGVPFFAFDGVFTASFVGADSLGFGTISANGTFTTSLIAPFLPAGVQGANVFAQSFFVDASLAYIVVGPASAVTVLDSSL